MKTRAFTLIELLAVIVLLGILGIVIIPKVGDAITNSKETALVTQQEEIKKAAYDFMVDNIELFEKNNTITIKLGILKQKGYLPVNIKNPKTRKNISNESIITITKNDGNYNVQLNLIDLENVTENTNPNTPIVVLNGDYIEYIDVNSTYQEKGAIAKSSTGETISNVSIQIKQNNVEKSSIDTSQLSTYNVIYSATDSNGITTSATRTVIIRDTEAPIITIPKETILHVSELADFNIMDGVTVTDNYSINPEITTNSSLASIPGNYIITYTATDSSRNQTIERRIINVDGNFANYYTTLEYIEFTGTQYIDIGYKSSADTKVEIDFDSTSSAKWLFGSRTSASNTDCYGVFLNSNTQYWARIGGNTDNTAHRLNNVSTLGRHKIYATSSSLILDDTSSISFTSDSTQGTHSIYIGTINNSSTSVDNRMFIGKIYNIKIWNNTTLEKNLVPCMRNRDNTVGLYDLVNNKFYTNIGTGTFKSGNPSN